MVMQSVPGAADGSSLLERNRLGCRVAFNKADASEHACGWCLNLQNDCCGVSTESGSDRVTILEFSILAISGDPVATALGTDLILKLRHHHSTTVGRSKSTGCYNHFSKNQNEFARKIQE